MSEARSLLHSFLDQLGEKRAWYRLPTPFGLLRLLKLRNELREKNLHDTERPPLEPNPDPAGTPADKVAFRTFDGTCNDLDFPRMGAAGSRFGRNFPLTHVHPDAANLMNPSPREISRKLLTRDRFRPAEILNVLAAAWIQFQVHDWFAHDEGKPEDSHEIPLKPGDPWKHGPMRVPRTPTAGPADGGPPAYANRNSHWWDGSQVYGSDEQTARKLRTGFDGKMKIGDTALLPLDEEGVELTGFRDNWWVGLSLLHALFVAEHNAVCDRLKLENPHWNDDKLFHHGRLVVAALMAKIHTVEWTPAILPHPTTAKALRMNWGGVSGEDLQELFEVFDDKEILGGIVGSPKADHHGVPYSLTEEFVAVYRMHPLMPDDYPIYSLDTGKRIGMHNLTEMSLGRTRSIMEKYRLRDLFYSLGVSHPGAVCLHNYPVHLQQLTKTDGTTIDLGAIDILRDRERGVPRYNDFRGMLRMKRLSSFDELTDDPAWAAEIKEVYGGDIDKVDLMVGLFAEPLIPGFGFSETAFRIFILMASRRLASDRFLTSHFSEEIYTRTGLDWVRDNSMITVLLRHHPALEPALRGVDNAFAPWRSVGRGG